MSVDLAVHSDRDRTLELATFFSDLTYDDLPDNVINAAKASIFNSIGCGLSSAKLDASKRIFTAIDVNAKEPRNCTILARPEPATMEDAALLNGVSMTARWFDDMYMETLVHPAGPPLAAVLAYAEANHLSGKYVILAFVVGVETLLAVSHAIGLGPYKKGWHLTSVAGTFGATAAVAKLMNLSPEKFAMALGHASSVASGSRNVFGTDTLILHAGRAAQNGILAARLAREGFGSTTQALERYVALISVGDSDPSEISKLCDNRQTPWLLPLNAFKAYPSGIVVHSLIDAGIKAHEFFFKDSNTRIPGKDGQDVLEVFPKIVARVTTLTSRLCGIQQPKDDMQVLFSVYHGLAVGLVFGKGGIREFSAEVAKEPLLAKLRDRITLDLDDTLQDGQTVVTVTCVLDGVEKSVEFRVDHPSGSRENPLTVKQLNAKFLDQAAEGSVNATEAKRAVEESWNLEKIQDITTLMKRLVAE